MTEPIPPATDALSEQQIALLIEHHTQECADMCGPEESWTVAALRELSQARATIAQQAAELARLDQINSGLVKHCNDEVIANTQLNARAEQAEAQRDALAAALAEAQRAAYYAGWQTGVNNVDRYGEINGDVDDDWAAYLAALQPPSPEGAGR
jgi:hypothetical protein